MTINERFQTLLKEKNISYKEAAQILGKTEMYVRKLCKPGESFGIEPVKSILNSINGINIEWLLTGKGKMEKGSSDPENEEKSNYPVKPYVESAYAFCGSPSGFSIAVTDEDCDKLSLPFMVNYDFSIRAKGDSMINRENPLRSIREGDIVACRIWRSRTHIRWGEIYALSTTEGVVIKKILPSEKEGHIKCVSFNMKDGFQPFELPLAEVSDWAIVVGVVSAVSWN